MAFEEIQINTDGGSRGNPGPAAIGVYAQSEGQVIFKISEFVGHATNNYAEYQAVIYALEHLSANNIQSQKVSFVLDSELVVRQLNGIYRIKDPNLQILNSRIRSLISQLIKTKNITLVTFTHVKRESNKEADALVNLALDKHI